jgi:hypothetical protein
MARTSPRSARSARSSNASHAAHAARPPQRQVTVIAQDPSVRRGGKIVTATISIPAEDLHAGPIGYRVQVVDYDATNKVFHGRHQLPECLEDEPKSWAAGEPKLVGDRRFHAQNVYALVMKTLARFEFALGRRVGWSFEAHQLKVAPHGVADANAFYSPEDEGLVFGSFEGVSGRPVHTCLSHDIVVHETTHALLDALRERYMDPSTPDQGAFHEGFADVIALLSVFSQVEVIEHLLRAGKKGRGALVLRRSELKPDHLLKSALFELAEQMGDELEETRGGPLRFSAKIAPDPKLKDSAEFLEEHRRGELFVAAVLQGFVAAWSQRVFESGVDGQTQFPLRRAAQEGADVADALATMWIRAIDYMPPVHLEFGDALAAAITADREVRPDDSRYHLRERMLASFARFGFVPPPNRASRDGILKAPPQGLDYSRVRFDLMKSEPEEVFRFLWENRGPLELREGAYTKVLSVRPSTRIGPDGILVRETVAQYYQVARLTPDELEQQKIQAPAGYLKELRRTAADREAKAKAAGEEAVAESGAPEAAPPDVEADTTPLYGGGVLIFDEYGRLKYWIDNDVFGPWQKRRLAYLWNQGLLRPGRRGRAQLVGQRLSTLHRRRAWGRRVEREEGW